MLLPFVEPCSATRPLWEIVCNDLCRNVAFPAPSEQLLQEIRAYSDDYEAKIAKNLQRLSVALMEDLLAFLQKDALSFEEIRTKIDTGGYENPSGPRRRGDIFCFHNLSRWSFDKIQGELTNPPDASKPNFRHLSDTTLKIFREAEALFQEYVQACAKIFNVTEEIAEIVRTGIRSWYDLKKSDILANELHKDPWYLAARASDGSWSTVLYSVMVPHTMQFSSKKMEDFINSVTTDFNKCIDGSTVNDVDLKKNIKQQFRDNCIEYLLRGVYVRYNTPSAERDNLVRAILKYARETSDGSAPRPSEIKHTLGIFIEMLAQNLLHIQAWIPLPLSLPAFILN